jgi:D-alanyl-D-alanine carboxypeptidase
MTKSRRLLTFLFLILLVVPSAIGTANAQEAAELNINSTRYIVVDAATGHVFAQRGANDRVAIASLTKVFTALQAMEMAPLDTIITTKDSDLRAPDGSYFGTNGTLMGFGEGEEYTLEDMLYGMLLPSGNDAANAIARNLGYREGDTDEEAIQHFLDLLNQRIADMGLENTHLMNPHGWGVDGHYSSAADVAAFNRFVMHYPRLIEIMGTSSYTTSNGAISVTNTNKSLNQYASVEAGKTGYDWDAGYCLVNIARRGDTGIIAVTLDGVAPNDWYDDNATLLDYGFDQQAELVSSGEPWEGDVAAYVDPSAAIISRSAHAGSSFANDSAARAADEAALASGEPVSQQPRVTDQVAEPRVQESSPREIAEGSIWIVAGATIGLLGLRGYLMFRKEGRVQKSRPDEPASLVTSSASD